MTRANRLFSFSYIQITNNCKPTNISGSHVEKISACKTSNHTGYLIRTFFYFHKKAVWLAKIGCYKINTFVVTVTIVIMMASLHLASSLICLLDTQAAQTMPPRAGRYTNFGDSTVFYKIPQYK